MAVSLEIERYIRRRRAEGIGPRLKPKKPPKWLFPNSVAREYKKEINTYTRTWIEVVREVLLPHIDLLVLEANSLRPDGFRLDDWIDDITKILDATSTAFLRRARKPEDIAVPVAQKTSDFNKKQFNKVIKSSIGVDVILREPWLRDELKSFAKENASLIGSITDQNRTQIEGIAQRGLRQGKSASFIKREIMEQTGVAERRGELIARDQVSKLNGQLTHLRQKEVGIDKYVWRSSQDERSREEHAAREGQEFSWDQPPSGGHPSEAVNCRCYAEPVVDNLLNIANDN